jgi:hypothetical protein
MKNNKRLKVIGILFAFFYFFIIGEYIVTEEISSFKAGYSEGRDKAREEWDKLALKKTEICFLNIIPKAGLYSFPTKFANLKGEDIIKASVGSMTAKVQYSKKLPIWLKIFFHFAMILAFPILFLLLYIPVQAYKTIRSIVKDDIFNLKTITRIRRIGYALLIIFGCSLWAMFIEYLIGKHLISLEDYDIVFSMKNEYIFLLFGLITLLFAEILKISHVMKEEQDLTI